MFSLAFGVFVSLNLTDVAVLVSPSDREIEQLFYSFLAGGFPVSVLALLAQLVLVPLLVAVCFFDQRESLRQQVQAFLDEGASGSIGGSSSTDLRLLSRHSSRLADFVMHLDVHKTLGYFVFLFAMAFVVAALVEEFLKFWIVQGACCCSSRCKGSSVRGCTDCKRSTAATTRFQAVRQPNYQSGGPRGWLCHPSRLLFFHKKHSNHCFVVFMATVAGALGFSFVENVAFTFSAQGFRERALAAILRGCVSSTLHCICGGITGVRIALTLQEHRVGVTSIRDSAVTELGSWRTKLRVIYPAVLVHGLFDFQIFLFATLVTAEMIDAHPTRYGIVLPGAVTVLVLVAAFAYLRRTLDTMEEKMNEGRYIQVAVDLESGRRVSINHGKHYDDDEFDEFDPLDEDDDVEGESDGAAANSSRKVRSVFNV